MLRRRRPARALNPRRANPNDQTAARAGSRGFTLVELLVVIAIIGVLVGLLLPAVQAAREAARRTQCVNNIRQLALGNVNYESSHGTLPYARKNDQWDTYTWTQLILPFIEQQALYDLYWDIDSKTEWRPAGTVDARKKQARLTQVPAFYCPSDGPVRGNELDSPQWCFWRGNYRGCTGHTDMYGEALIIDRNNTVVAGTGCFEVRPGQRQYPDKDNPVETLYIKYSQIVDGTSQTMLLSEGIVPTVGIWGGALGEIIYGNMGGALFTGYQTPNSSVPDNLYGPCPGDVGDTEYPNQTCLKKFDHPGTGPGSAKGFAAARSRHPGGVNYANADGSVNFASDGIDVYVWQATATRDNGEVISQ